MRFWAGRVKGTDIAWFREMDLVLTDRQLSVINEPGP